eukprot:2667784-Prymnesium_polylepis.1
MAAATRLRRFAPGLPLSSRGSVLGTVINIPYSGQARQPFMHNNNLNLVAAASFSTRTTPAAGAADGRHRQTRVAPGPRNRAALPGLKDAGSLVHDLMGRAR